MRLLTPGDKEHDMVVGLMLMGLCYKTLDRYIESINNDNEDRDLILQLKNVSEKYPETKEIYHEARIHQYFYNKRLAKKREDGVVGQFMDRLCEKARHEDEIERLRSEIDGALSMLGLVQEPSCDQSAWLELAIEKLEKAREG